MRADARRNRERITTAAQRLFAEQGPGASMEEIARAAGLGVGTLYRHFPDRQALAEEIAEVALRDLMDTARAATGRERPPWDTLRELVEHCTGRPMTLLKSLLETGAEAPGLRELQATYNALLADVVRAAQKDGTLRGDLTPDEVMGLLNLAVCRPGARVDDAVVTVVLDGLRSRDA